MSERLDLAVGTYMSEVLGYPITADELRKMPIDQLRFELEEKRGKPLQFTSRIERLISHEQVGKMFDESMKTYSHRSRYNVFMYGVEDKFPTLYRILRTLKVPHPI